MRDSPADSHPPSEPDRIRRNCEFDTLNDKSAPDTDLDAGEVEQLRRLVGDDEKAYWQLKLDLLAARDHAIGAEAEAGQLRALIVDLDDRMARLHRQALDIEKRAKLAEQQIEKIYASTTWRVGTAVIRPLFNLRRLLRGQP